MLFYSQASRFLSYFNVGIDWDQLIYMDRVTDILGLIYWGYVIIMLQFNDKVKQEFCAPPQETATEQKI